MDIYYPPMDLAVLQRIDLIRRLASENKDFFTKSPYDPAVVAWLSAPVAEAMTGAIISYAEMDAPEEEAESLFKQLKSLKNSLTDTADQLTYVKTAATLLDKIVSVKERAMSVKRMIEFEKLVLDTLQDVMTPEQRTRFQDRMANANLS